MPRIGQGFENDHPDPWEWEVLEVAARPMGVLGCHYENSVVAHDPLRAPNADRWPTKQAHDALGAAGLAVPGLSSWTMSATHPGNSTSMGGVASKRPSR